MADAGGSMNAINSMLGMSNSNRVSGLASGIDVDSIMQQIMTAESQPLIQMQQRLQIMEWQRDDYRSMNTLLADLEDTVFPMKLQSSFLAKTATSGDESKVTAEAGANAGNATYTLSDITMATSATNFSAGSIVKDGVTDFDPTKSLASQKDKLVNGDAIGNTIEFTLSTYNQDGEKVDKAFTFDSSVSLDGMLQAVSQSGIGVNAFYDSATGRVSMTRTDTGNMHVGNEGSGEDVSNGDATFGGAEIEFSGSFLTDTLQMDATNETGGTDATFTLNGMETSRHANTFTVGGVTYTLKGNTSADEQVTVRVNSDTDAVVKKINEFVDKYNEVIEKINGELSEERYRDYPPLTDLQKSEMNDSDIEKWEEKARSGMLAGDSILSGALSQMRLDLYSSVTGTSNEKMNQLSELGITTSSDYTENGKLVVDQDKLKKAVGEDPQAVMELFTKQGDGSSSSGIMQRLDETLKSAVSRIEDKAGKTTWTEEQYTMGRGIDDLNERIDAFKERLIQVESRYYSQFDAMEAAIQQANAQAGYLQQFLGQ